MADANEVMADFNEIYTNITNVNIAPNAAIAFSKLATLTSANILVGSAGNVATSVAMSGDATISNTGVVSLSASAGGIVPIGTIIPFQDFGILTFDTTRWKYCDGTQIPGPVTPTNPLGGLFTTDMSGRCIIGFGTIGAGNIGAVPWGAGAVGNTNNTINIQHSHTVNAHTHTGPSHTHDMANHTHTGGNHTHDMANHTHDRGTYQALALGDYFQTEAAALWLPNLAYAPPAAPPGPNQNTAAVIQGSSGVPSTNTTGSGGAVATGGPSTNTTGAEGTGATGSTSPGTDNQLSAVQDIRPSSIRVRYLIRYT